MPPATWAAITGAAVWKHPPGNDFCRGTCAPWAKIILLVSWGYSELGIFQEKKNHRGHLIQVSNSLRKKNVSGGMSTIALKLFGGEREEKAREQEVPGYIV